MGEVDAVVGTYMPSLPWCFGDMIIIVDVIFLKQHRTSFPENTRHEDESIIASKGLWLLSASVFT